MADSTFKLSVVSPERLVLSEEVEEAQVPGKNGYLGILPGHAPMMTELDIGELSYRQGDRTAFLAVTWGYCEVLANQVIVLAERAERAEEVDTGAGSGFLGAGPEAAVEPPGWRYRLPQGQNQPAACPDSGAGEPKGRRERLAIGRPGSTGGEEKEDIRQGTRRTTKGHEERQEDK